MTATALPLVFVDTETTSLRRDRRPWEIAMIRREPDGTETEHVIQIRDLNRVGADVDALEVGGFYDRYVGDDPPYRYRIDPELAYTARLRLPGDPPPQRILFENEAARLVEKITRKAIFIGVNPAFDADTLTPMLERHGLNPAWHYSVVDLKAMAAGWLHNRPDRWPSSESLAKAHDEIKMWDLRAGKLATSPAVTQRHQAEHRLALARNRAYELQRQQADFLTPPWRSYELSAACGAEPPTDDEKHTALGDARWAMRWYDALTGKTA